MIGTPVGKDCHATYDTSWYRMIHWWFGRFGWFFPSYWEFHNPNWRTPSFFRGVETTNQIQYHPHERSQWLGSFYQCPDMPVSSYCHLSSLWEELQPQKFMRAHITSWINWLLTPSSPCPTWIGDLWSISCWKQRLQSVPEWKQTTFTRVFTESNWVMKLEEVHTFATGGSGSQKREGVQIKGWGSKAWTQSKEHFERFGRGGSESAWKKEVPTTCGEVKR